MASKRTIPYDTWSGTGTETESFTYSERGGERELLFRWVNDLDVEVTVDIKLTDSYDDNNSRTVAAGSHTIASGSVENDTLSEQWDKVVVDVTPTNAPSGGEMQILELE